MRSLTIAALALACACVTLGTLGGSALGAKVRVGTLVVTADGGFAPHLLPRQTYAPIRFQGRADIKTTNGAPPPAPRRIRLDFDRDGKVNVSDLGLLATHYGATAQGSIALASSAAIQPAAVRMSEPRYDHIHSLCSHQLVAAR